MPRLFELRRRPVHRVARAGDCAATDGGVSASTSGVGATGLSTHHSRGTLDDARRPINLSRRFLAWSYPWRSGDDPDAPRHAAALHRRGTRPSHHLA